MTNLESTRISGAASERACGLRESRADVGDDAASNHGALHEQELAPGHAAQAQQTLLPFCERWQLLSAPSATAPRRSEMVATHSRLI